MSTTKTASKLTKDVPASRPSTAAELIARAKARRASMESGTVASRIVESTGPLTVKDVRLQQPRAVKGYRINVAASLKPDTPIGDLTPRQLQEAVVHSAIQGDGTRQVIQSEDDYGVSASRNLLHQSDEDSVLDGLELADQLALGDVDEAGVGTALARKNAALRGKK